MPTMTFAERQDAVLAFIRRYWRSHGYAPTVYEIVDGVPLSSTSVAGRHLDRLASRGLIASGEHSRPRTIKPLGVGCPACGCPGHGDLDAG